MSVNGFASACSPKASFAFIPCLEEEEIDMDELENLLKLALVNVEGDHAAKKRLLKKNSCFRKCIRIYP